MKSSKNNEIKVGVIGTGGRGRAMFLKLQEVGEHIHLKSVYDPDKELAIKLISDSKFEDAKVCNDFREITTDPEIDWVMVMSPNCYHCEHILSSFENGKHVFAEKPLATTIEDCQKIHNAHQKSGLLFATGFVLRYAPLYNKVREILDAGTIGKILSIDANENVTPSHGAYIMKNWRRYTKFSGPHILEKCCHDLDLINWFIGDLPTKVASFGGRDFFLPKNHYFMDKFKNKDGESSPFSGWEDPHGAESPFTSDKDIVDNQVAIIEYRNRARVMFQATLSNAIPERRMYFSGTEGNIIAELYSASIKVKRIGDGEEIQTFDFSGKDMHGGGDVHIMKYLYNSMTDGVLPICSGEEGLQSSILALAIEQARIEGKIIDLEPIWLDLER